MTKFIHNTALIVGTIIVVLTVQFFLDPRNRALFSSGPVRSGQLYGIEIGSSSLEAFRKLDRYGLVRGRVPNTGRCMALVAEDNEKLDLFSDNSWRRGTVCLATEGGKVTGIDTYFSMGLTL